MDAAWKWVECELSEFAQMTFEDASVRYRGDAPIALQTRFSTFSGYVAVNLLSPIRSVFWAAPTFAMIWAFEGGERNTLFGDKGAAELFKQDLRRAKITLHSRSAEWLRPVIERLGLARRAAPSLCRQHGASLDRFRVQSLLLRESDIGSFRAALDRQTAELGSFAFFGLDERADLFGFGGEGLPYPPDMLFAQPLIMPMRTEPDELFGEPIRDLLRRNVERLERGLPFDFSQRPWFIRSGSVTLALLGSAHSEPVCYWTEDNPTAREIMSYRARLIRLLAWPSHFDSVGRELTHDQGGDQIRNLRDLKITEPFDAVFELEAYISEMETKYPTLIEWRGH